MQARYARAAAWFDAQEYDAAAKAFAELGSYEDAKQRVTASEDAWLSADYNSAKMDTEVGNYAAVIDELEPYYGSDLPARYAEMNAMYESACLMRAQELTALGRPLDALPILRRIEDNKTAKKRLEAYVYQIIGRWKDNTSSAKTGAAAFPEKKAISAEAGMKSPWAANRIRRRAHTAWSACAEAP